MKRITAIILALVIAITLCACGFPQKPAAQNDSGKPETANDPQTSASATAVPSETKTPQKSPEPAVNGNDPATPEPSPEAHAKRSYTLSDEVIVDNEYCTFKIIKAEEDNFWGFTLKAYCENKTSDKSLMFSIDDVSVNGYMCDPFWAEQVAAGKKSNDDITFSSTSFKEIGIDTADEITFSLRVHDYDDWMADDFVHDVFTIYPTGLDAASVSYPARRSTSSEKVIVDNDDICFIILENTVDSIWGYTLKCYLENKTDKSVMFNWDDVSVNGFMIDPFWAREIAPGMRGYSDINFSDSEFEENGITEVEEIEFTFNVHDSDDWFANDLFDEVCTYAP